MPPELTGTIIGAGAGAIQTGGNILSTILANKANRSLAEYSYEQQKQMIREQNEYNSPKYQMERYQEAGLNPNLIYGDGSSMSGNQSTIARYEAPTMQAPSLGNAMSSAAQIAMQYSMMKKDLALKDVELSNKYVENSLMNQEFLKRQRDNNLQSLLLGVPDPFNGYSEEQLQSMSRSPLFMQYKSEADTAYEEYLLTKARNTFQDLSNQEKEFVINNIQPLTENFMKLRNEGVSKSNAILQVRKDLNEALKYIGGERGAAMIWLVLRSLIAAMPM